MTQEGFTKLRNGLYMDNRTRKIGHLAPAPNGGWYIEELTREKSVKDLNTRLFGRKKSYYEDVVKRWKEKLKNPADLAEKEMIESQIKEWGKQLAQVQETEEDFNNLYDNPQEAEYVSGIVDYNAKTREERYANYAVEDVTKRDKAIESDIHSLFIYQNEKNMGAGEKDPLKKYYDKYGKENVDRVWADMDKKYAVIQGVTMDSEGLRYNTLVEKDKYSPEAIQYYQNATEQAWKNYSGDSKEYNRYVNNAEKEFLEFDSKRSSWEKEITMEEVKNSKITPIKIDPVTRKVVDEDKYDEERRKFQQTFADRINNGEDEKKVLREATEYGFHPLDVRRVAKYNKEKERLFDKYDKEEISHKEYNEKTDELKRKYGIEKADEVLADREARTVTEEKWSDKDKYEYDLYKRAKENPDSIDPMTENSTDWDALDKKWSNRYDYDKEQEEFGTEAQVERFKERKGSATKTDNGVKETYTKSGKINYKAFGIERTPENDFTDDGTRFSSYMLSNGMEMTVAKANDETYMSVRTPYDKEISYQEYSNLPHYKDLDMYNGVSGKVDLNKLVESANAYMNEYNELKKQKGLPVDERSVYQRRLDNMESAIKMANESYDYHYNYYKNHPGEYSGWRRHENEARKAKNKAYKLAQKREKFISENEKIEAQVERFKERKGKVSKKDMSYGDFLEKKFGSRIDRNDLTEDDDDRYYKEYLKYINK